MSKIAIVFILLLLTYAIGIEMFRRMTYKEKWSTVKILGYASACAVLSAVTLIVIVYTF